MIQRTLNYLKFVWQSCTYSYLFTLEIILSYEIICDVKRQLVAVLRNTLRSSTTRR